MSDTDYAKDVRSEEYAHELRSIMRTLDRDISHEDLAELVTSIVRLYALRVEQTGNFPQILTKKATATDVVIVVCEMLRAQNINLFDLMMWYDRRQSQES